MEALTRSVQVEETPKRTTFTGVGLLTVWLPLASASTFAAVVATCLVGQGGLPVIPVGLLLAFVALGPIGKSLRPSFRMSANADGLSIGRIRPRLVPWKSVVAMTLEHPRHVRVVIDAEDGLQVYSCRTPRLSWSLDQLWSPRPTAVTLLDCAASYVGSSDSRARRPGPDVNAQRHAWLMSLAVLVPSLVFACTQPRDRILIALLVDAVAFVLVTLRIRHAMRFAPRAFEDWRAAVERHRPVGYRGEVTNVRS